MTRTGEVRSLTTAGEVWRDCAPCELMDEAFGAGAKDALRQRCGISATVLSGGTIRLGDHLEIS